MSDIKELRGELLEEAMDYLKQRFNIQKSFAKMFFEHKLTQGMPIENYTNYMPTIYSPQEAIDLAKQMESYVVGTTVK